jgi:CHAD domain-containing protein
MSFSFKSRSGAAHQVRAIVGSQVEKALETARAGEDFDKTVHALRRRCKKIRGVLRLVRPNFGDYKNENDAVRSAADLLGGVRDAQVMVETLDGLTVAGHTQAAREHLVARVDRLARAMEASAPLERFAEIFAALGARARDWSFDTNGFDLVGDGLEATYRQFLRDMDAAEDGEDAVAMHEWRKHAKYHWYHVSLLEKSAPDLLPSREEALDQLGEYLGDHHNLHVLEETLRGMGDEIGDLAPIVAAIEARQEELADRAFALGRQLAADKPSALRKRFEAWWGLLPRDA